MAKPKPPSFLIIGYGHFGSRAAEILFSRHPGSKITVVDQDRKALQEISRPPRITVISQGTLYLDRFLSTGERVDYIVPAVPFHLAFELILSTLRAVGAKRGDVPALSGLPNASTGRTGDLYTSLADFLCPEDCSEPAARCPVTGERRQRPMYRILAEVTGPFESRVIRSRQLAPGVGGFRPEALLDAVGEVRKKAEPGHLFLISTACRCHGVTSAVSFERPTR